jgi:UDP-glucose 4-epimerase
VRVLITGGCGFLGAAFADGARAAGHSVVTLDVDREADMACDVADAAAVTSALDDARPDAVVHLAAVLTDTGERDPLTCVSVNAIGTSAVFVAAEACRARRVIYASSNAAVGPSSRGAGDGAPLDPRTVYGVTKAFGEHLARAMSVRAAAPAYLALRFGWIYGPGRVRGWSEPQKVLMRAIAGERRIEYPDYPEPIDWTYVDDAVEVLLRALERPLPRYAVCNAMGDRRRMADAIAHLRERFPDLVAEPFPAQTPASAWSLVNDGIVALLGAKPSVKLEQGIDRLIAAQSSASTIG